MRRGGRRRSPLWTPSSLAPFAQRKNFQSPFGVGTPGCLILGRGTSESFMDSVVACPFRTEKIFSPFGVWELWGGREPTLARPFRTKVFLSLLARPRKTQFAASGGHHGRGSGRKRPLSPVHRGLPKYRQKIFFLRTPTTPDTPLLVYHTLPHTQLNNPPTNTLSLSLSTPLPTSHYTTTPNNTHHNNTPKHTPNYINPPPTPTTTSYSCYCYCRYCCRYLPTSSSSSTHTNTNQPTTPCLTAPYCYYSTLPYLYSSTTHN